MEINGASRDVLELTRDEVRKNGVSVLTHFAGPSPTIQADQVQLQQVILKLIIRAVEAMSSMTAGRTRAAHLDDDTDAYQMHDQREFLISSATSDLWVCWAGRAHAVASSD